MCLVTASFALPLIYVLALSVVHIQVLPSSAYYQKCCDAPSTSYSTARKLLEAVQLPFGLA